ncbi:hypothetical protein WJX75_003287 [Coccomyxa subellipsoidea]|uniref:AP2/ERF domain-containing protein n=1 Tax=Coccomyxa subellipsoidea TaxID=248742 RepID=A0ABR2YPI4_9CHLO
MEKRSELLMQSIISDFGISEEEMSAIGEGHPAQWPMALSHLSPMTLAAASLPTSTALSKPLLLKFGHPQQSLLSAESNQPPTQDALSSMPLISTVIALPSLSSGVRDMGTGVSPFPSQNMTLCSAPTGGRRLERGAQVDAHARSADNLQVETGSPGDARKRTKVNPQPSSRARFPKDAPSESAVRHMARSAQTALQEVSGKESPESGTSVNAGADSGPGKSAARGRSGKSAKVVKDRSSQYRGVTKHRRSGRWEAHLWVKELGRQVYLGGYENEEHAAEAYDVAALKCKGPRVRTNFPLSRYSDLTECMGGISVEELIMAVRRQSQGFSRGTSAFRGVTHHPSGRWEARIGVPGSKHIYLGLFTGEREAAKAYDRALVRLRGTAAATNFALSDYRSDLADYHKMQQKVLQADGAASANLLSPNSGEFERWIKVGLDAPAEKSTESSC